jgi:hypothetical protein
VDGYIPLGLGYQAVLSPEREAGSTSWTRPPIKTSIDSDPRPGFLCSVLSGVQDRVFLERGTLLREQGIERADRRIQYEHDEL